MLSPLFFGARDGKSKPNKKPSQGKRRAEVPSKHAQCEAEDIQPVPALVPKGQSLPTCN